MLITINEAKPRPEYNQPHYQILGSALKVGEVIEENEEISSMEVEVRSTKVLCTISHNEILQLKECLEDF